MYGIIATWRMALEGISKADSMLKNNESAADSIEEAIKAVEDFEYYKSVGYGGLPNEEMEVELDAAFMDGDTLEFGCVGGIKDFANPVSIARSLMHYDANNFLIGQGAEKYASRHGFERKTMLTEFDDSLFTEQVDTVIVYSREEIGFRMKCGPVFRERV